jgi:hypothetical protein
MLVAASVDIREPTAESAGSVGASGIGGVGGDDGGVRTEEFPNSTGSLLFPLAVNATAAAATAAAAAAAAAPAGEWTNADFAVDFDGTPSNPA